MSMGKGLEGYWVKMKYQIRFQNETNNDRVYIAQYAINILLNNLC